MVVHPCQFCEPIIFRERILANGGLKQISAKSGEGFISEKQQEQGKIQKFSSSDQRSCLSKNKSCCDQLTAVKTRYPLTSITWPYRGLSCRAIEVEYLFEVIRWQVTSFQMIAGSSLFFFNSYEIFKNLFMLSLRISSYGCTREVWRARKIRKSCTRRPPSATLASWVLSKLP